MFTATLIVIFTVASVFGLQRLTAPWVKKLLDWLPAILFAYLIPAVITHLSGWDFSQVALHRLSKDWIIPLAILSVMSALSFRQLKIIGWRPIILFVSGSFLIAILPVLLVLLYGKLEPTGHALFMEQGYWKGLVPIVGSWIGGSTSQLVLKELVGCGEALFLSILVLDNIIVNIWTILMFQFIQRSDTINRFFSITDQVPDFVPDELNGSYRSPASIARTLVLLVVMVLVVHWGIGSFLGQVILLSLLGLALGNFVPGWNHALVLKLGGVLIVLIMAILGLKLNFTNLSMPLALVGLVICWLILHFAGMLLVARLLKLHMAWVPIASMANLGGISTAPAVTAAYNEEWMPHAILLAILSMVSGNIWGMFTIYLFQTLLR